MARINNKHPGTLITAYKSCAVLILLCILFISPRAIGQASASEFVFSAKGNIPLLITAPHAGPPKNAIPGVPIRTGKGIKKGFEMKWDARTGQIVTQLLEELKSVYGIEPYTVIARFNRKYIDANRAPNRAYESQIAEKYYGEYHGSILSHISEINEKWKGGLLIDLHGQSKKPASIWIGTRKGQTIRPLLKRYTWSCIYDQKTGLLGILKQKGYPIFPDIPGTSEKPYNGGYTTYSYGHKYDNNMDALQLEIGKNYRLNDKAREKLIVDLAYAIFIFYKAYLEPTYEQ